MRPREAEQGRAAFAQRTEQRTDTKRRYWPTSMLDEVLLEAGRRGMAVYADDVGMHEMGFEGVSAGGGEA